IARPQTTCDPSEDVGPIVRRARGTARVVERCDQGRRPKITAKAGARSESIRFRDLIAVQVAVVLARPVVVQFENVDERRGAVELPRPDGHTLDLGPRGSEITQLL